MSKALYFVFIYVAIITLPLLSKIVWCISKDFTYIFIYNRQIRYLGIESDGGTVKATIWASKITWNLNIPCINHGKSMIYNRQIRYLIIESDGGMVKATIWDSKITWNLNIPCINHVKYISMFNSFIYYMAWTFEYLMLYYVLI